MWRVLVRGSPTYDTGAIPPQNPSHHQPQPPMEHHGQIHHSPRMHEPYNPWTHHQVPTVPSSSTNTNMTSNKRHLSDSECDDVYSEESSNKDTCGSPAAGDNCQLMTRKRRRGIIEKRRRDRINNSLTELRRLVPAAFEKQGSAKLEKAEILQLTVEHLRNLHNKDSSDPLSYDSHKVAMDYHGLGFRECAAEVARYLVTVEGMDVQEPLRLRLMSHLQCFAAQREIANKQAAAAAASVWPGTPSAFTQTSYVTSQVGSASSPTLPPPPPAAAPISNHPASTLEPINYDASPPSAQGHQYQYTPTPPFQSNSPYNPNNGQMKPYRPWGAEVAY